MNNRTAIVTGYSSGLGWALTASLLDRGYKVVGVSRKSEPADVPSEHADNLTAVHGSVDSDETVQAAFDAARALGSVSLVINCAGRGVFGDIGSYSARDVSEAIQGNLAGLIVFSDYAVREMANDGGSVVNVMSTAAKKLRPAESVYVATKWGAKAYTRTLRDAVKAKKLPVKVFEVYPCGMNTPFWSDAIRPVASRESFPSPEPIAEAILANVLAESPVYTQEITFERS